MQRYLRKYKLTIGSPLSFYEGEVSSELLTTPPDRLAQRAVRNEQLARSFEDSFQRARNVLVRDGNVIGTNSRNNLLDPDRFKYERFILEQEQLIEEVNIQQAKGAVIEGLNISFDLAKGEDDKSNHITIYNISNDSRNLLVQRGSKFNPVIKLEAGYENDSELALVFLGEVVHVTDVWEGATRVTRLQVQAAATSKKEAFTLRTYKRDTPVETIVRDVIKDMRLNYGVLYIPEQNGTEIKVDKNYYIQCQSWEGLVNLCGKYELQASIEDGKVNVTPKFSPATTSNQDSVSQFLNVGIKVDKSTNEIQLGKNIFDAGSVSGLSGIAGVRVPPINTKPFTPRPQTPRERPQDFNDGLVAPFTVQQLGVKFDRTVAKVFNTQSGSIIGSPIAEAGNQDSQERAKGKVDAIKIKVFLDATLKLHDVVQVKANLIDAIYEIKGIRHFGEFEGREWYTELTLAALDTWVVDTGVDDDNLKALKALQDKYRND